MKKLINPAHFPKPRGYTNGVVVQHIMPDGELRPHKLTTGAVVENGRVTYPGQKSLFN